MFMSRKAVDNYKMKVLNINKLLLLMLSKAFLLL